MNGNDIANFFASLDGGWVKSDKTVDTFKSGDPNREITGIAVAWMGYTETIKRALDLGCNFFITHEPTYFDHFDKDSSIFRFEQAKKKKEMIDNSGITILRCHDLWDQIPNIGIPDSWGESLGFGKAVEGEGYFRVYEAGQRTVYEVAKQIARIVKKYGQESVQLIGPGDVHVNRFVVGTGAATPLVKMMEKYEADLYICTDDGFTYWRDGAIAIDFEIPVVLLNHPVSEFDGMKNLSALLKNKFPNIPIHFLDQTCMYQNIEDIL